MNSKTICVLLLFAFSSFMANSQTKIGAGGGFMSIQLEEASQSSQNQRIISLSDNVYEVPILNCFVESKLTEKISGIMKVSYTKINENANIFAPIEFFTPPQIEFSMISSNFMLNTHLLQRDKKKHSFNQLNLGFGGGFHRIFNFVDKSEFITTEEPSNDLKSLELALSWEVSFNIKNFRIAVLRSKGRINIFDKGLVDKSGFYSVTGSYIFQL